jgi:hypothetical protein
MHIKYTKGQFISFKLLKEKIHSGELEIDIYGEDEVEFDGQVLRYGGKDYPCPRFRAAIVAGWFEPTSAYTLAPPADRAGGALPAPARRPQLAVADDERTVGFATKEARDKGSNHNSAAVSSRAVLADSSDGVVISRVRTAAHQRTVLDSRTNVTQEINRLDNTPVKVTPAKHHATGDVQQALAGDDLEDILPNAASTGKPTPKRAENSDAAARAEAARKARLASISSTQKAPAPIPEEVGALEEEVGADDDMGDLFGDLIDSPAPESASGEVEVGEEVDAETVKARLAMVRLAVPGFEWDLTAPPKTRIKLALEKRSDPLYFNAILAVETDAVKAQLTARLRA